MIWRRHGGNPYPGWPVTPERCPGRAPRGAVRAGRIGGPLARRCPSCGQPLPEESVRFCVDCGTDVTAEQWPTGDFPSLEPDPGWPPTASPWEGGASPPGQPDFSPPQFAPPPPQPTSPPWHSEPASRGRPPHRSHGRPPLRSHGRPRLLSRGRPRLRRRSPRRSPPWPPPGLAGAVRVVPSLAVCAFARVRVVPSVAVRVSAAGVRPVRPAADRISTAAEVNPSQAAPREAHRHRGRGRDRGHRRGYRHRAARAPWQPGCRRQQRCCPEQTGGTEQCAAEQFAAKQFAAEQFARHRHGSRRSWRG